MPGAFFGGKRVAKRGIIYTRGMNLDDFSYTENDRRYINPQVSLNEQNAFIDNLRNMQGQDTAQIRQDTYNLGTAVPSNLGGLAGGSGYFRSRYQTPQTNSMVADLRAAAQSQALSTLLNNEIGKAQKRYQDAYRAAKKRANNGTGGGTNDPSNYLESLKTRTTNEYGAGDRLGIEDLGEDEAWDSSSIANLERQLAIARGKVADQRSKWGDNLLGGLSWWEKASGAGLPVMWTRTDTMRKNIAEVEELERKLMEAKNGQ